MKKQEQPVKLTNPIMFGKRGERYRRKMEREKEERAKQKHPRRADRGGVT